MRNINEKIYKKARQKQAENKLGDFVEEKEKRSSVIKRLYAEVKNLITIYQDQHSNFYICPKGKFNESVPMVRDNLCKLLIGNLLFESSGVDVSDQVLQKIYHNIEIEQFTLPDKFPMYSLYNRFVWQDKSIIYRVKRDEYLRIENNNIYRMITDNPPVPFWKGINFVPQDIDYSGSLDDFNNFLDFILKFNKNKNENKIKLIAFLMCSFFREKTSNPFLIIQGERQSGKTKLALAALLLIDPNNYLTKQQSKKTLPKIIDWNEYLYLVQNHVHIYDNLSDHSISTEASDSLCKIFDGDKSQTRTFKSQDGIKMYDAEPSLIFTCVEPIIKRTDLLERSISINANRIDEGEIPDDQFY